MRVRLASATFILNERFPNLINLIVKCNVGVSTTNTVRATQSPGKSNMLAANQGEILKKNTPSVLPTKTLQNLPWHQSEDVSTFGRLPGSFWPAWRSLVDHFGVMLGSGWLLDTFWLPNASWATSGAVSAGFLANMAATWSQDGANMHQRI